MVCTKRFKLLTGGIQRVNGTAEKATAKNICNIFFLFRERFRGESEHDTCIIFSYIQIAWLSSFMIFCSTDWLVLLILLGRKGFVELSICSSRGSYSGFIDFLIQNQLDLVVRCICIVDLHKDNGLGQCISVGFSEQLWDCRIVCVCLAVLILHKQSSRGFLWEREINVCLCCNQKFSQILYFWLYCVSPQVVVVVMSYQLVFVMHH